MNVDNKKVLSMFAARIPSTVFGPERIRYIVEHIKELQIEQKLMILNLINYILGTMIDRQASDVEIGGYGTQGYIWYRIFGKKERALDMPQLTEDEASVLIVTLMNENQGKYILDNRNLDFSYTFKYEKVGINVEPPPPGPIFSQCGTGCFCLFVCEPA